MRSTWSEVCLTWLLELAINDLRACERRELWILKVIEALEVRVLLVAVLVWRQGLLLLPQSQFVHVSLQLRRGNAASVTTTIIIVTLAPRTLGAANFHRRVCLRDIDVSNSGLKLVDCN